MELLLFVLIILIYIQAATSADPESVYGRKGSFYTFVCPHRKDGTNSVSWSFINKTGTNIPVSYGEVLYTSNPAHNRVDIVGDHSNGEYNMKLSGLQETDEGTYRCDVFPQQKDYYLELLAAPSDLVLYNVVDSNLIGTEGQSLTINCTAIGGKPPPDMRLEVDSQVSTGMQSILYTIPVLQRSHDKQLVKCQAHSDALGSPMEMTATLYLYLKPFPPTFNQNPPRTNDTQPLIVSCTSTGSRPAGAVVYWKVKSVPVTGGIVQQNTSVLSTDTYTVASTLTYSVDRSYNGQSIACGVTHQTLIQALEVTKTLDVQFAPDVTVPNKTHTQTDTTRTIQCTAVGNPTSYTYYKWQHKSVYGVLIRELKGGDNGILTLPSVAESDRYQDSGEYICTVSNGIGDKDGKIKHTGSGYMIINVQPVYTLDNDDLSTQYAEFGKSTDVHVYVYSVPKYTKVTWYKGSTVLPNNDKYDMKENSAIIQSSFHGVAVELNGFQLTLTINNLVQGDFTEYKLRLNNGYGQQVEHTVQLESASAPITPVNFSVTDIKVSNISFEWVPGFNGGYEQKFHIEYRVSGSSSWIAKEIPKTQKTGRQTFTLSGLSGGTLYELRLYAENKLNKSLPTDIESVYTIKDTKSSAGATNGGAIGGVIGGLVVVIVAVVVVVCIIKRRKDLVYGKQNAKSKKSDEVMYHNQLNSDMYEQIDGVTNDSRDIQQPNTEDGSTKKTYEELGMKDNPNFYAELSNQEGQGQYYSTAEQYESLGDKDKPNVYEDLQNKKDKLKVEKDKFEDLEAGCFGLDTTSDMVVSDMDVSAFIHFDLVIELNDV